MKFFKKTWRKIREPLDQLGHRWLGKIMAASMKKWGTREQQIQIVMDFAWARERLQHPDGVLGEGTERDIKNWEKGAKAGARKK